MVFATSALIKTCAQILLCFLSVRATSTTRTLATTQLDATTAKTSICVHSTTTHIALAIILLRDSVSKFRNQIMLATFAIRSVCALQRLTIRSALVRTTTPTCAPGRKQELASGVEIGVIMRITPIVLASTLIKKLAYLIQCLCLALAFGVVVTSTFAREINRNVTVPTSKNQFANFSIHHRLRSHHQQQHHHPFRRQWVLLAILGVLEPLRCQWTSASTLMSLPAARVKSSTNSNVSRLLTRVSGATAPNF